MPTSKTLDVYYQGKQVGTLAEAPDKRIAFQYSEQWQKTGFSISPFSLPIGSNVYVPNERALDRFGGLFGVFADSLPDSWGELLLDMHLEALGIKRGDLSTLDRLAYVGQNGMGALEYYPSKASDYDIKSLGIDFDTIAKECSNILSSKPSEKLDVLYKMGGSSGGTRPKILLSEDGKEWIVKFPAKSDPEISGKREYDYSVCAKECGINMTETALVPSSVCDGYFKTERFDRNDGQKVFSVTAAGLLEADFRAPSCDYETLFKLTRAITKDAKYDKEQLYKIMCFNVATHNRDDHTKNFSFLHTDSNGWKLAPAYDLTYSDTYWGEHTTSVNGKGRDIEREDLVSVGTGAGLSVQFCKDCLDEILDSTKALDVYMSSSKGKSHRHISYRERLVELSSKLLGN